jgi:hypothetical protein
VSTCARGEPPAVIVPVTQVVVHYEDTDKEPPVLSVDQALASGAMYPLPMLLPMFTPGPRPLSIGASTGRGWTSVHLTIHLLHANSMLYASDIHRLSNACACVLPGCR